MATDPRVRAARERICRWPTKALNERYAELRAEEEDEEVNAELTAIEDELDARRFDREDDMEDTLHLPDPWWTQP